MMLIGIWGETASFLVNEMKQFCLAVKKLSFLKRNRHTLTTSKTRNGKIKLNKSSSTIQTNFYVWTTFAIIPNPRRKEHKYILYAEKILINLAANYTKSRYPKRHPEALGAGSGIWRILRFKTFRESSFRKRCLLKI